MSLLCVVNPLQDCWKLVLGLTEHQFNWTKLFMFDTGCSVYLATFFH